MNNDGTRLVYKDQGTAEKVADQWRNKHRALLEKLRQMNERLDSVRLQQLIEGEMEAHA